MQTHDGPCTVRPMARPLLKSAAGLAALLGIACGSGSPARPDQAFVVERIQVDSVAVSVDGPPPAQVSARVTGVVGDGCATLQSIEQWRAGPQVSVEIKRRRPQAAVCTQIAQLFDRTIPLDGRFGAGSYSLQVNTVVRPFVVE